MSLINLKKKMYSGSQTLFF